MIAGVSVEVCAQLVVKKNAINPQSPCRHGETSLFTHMRVWGCHLVTSDDFNLSGLNQEVQFLRLKVSFVRVLWETLTWQIMEELPELWKKPDFMKKTWAYNYKLHRACVSRASVR